MPASSLETGRGDRQRGGEAREAGAAGAAAPAGATPAGAVPAGAVPAGAPGRLVVASKADQVGAEVVAGLELLVTSARTGQGLEALRDAVLERAAGGAGGGDEEVVLTSERQRRLVERAAAALERAERAGEAQQSEELMAADVREAAGALAQVLGERVGDDVLDALFARFCIGK